MNSYRFIIYQIEIVNLGLPDNWAVNCLQCTGFAFSAASLLLAPLLLSDHVQLAATRCFSRSLKSAILSSHPARFSIGSHTSVVLSVPAYPFDLVLRYAALRDALRHDLLGFVDILTGSRVESRLRCALSLALVLRKRLGRDGSFLLWRHGERDRCDGSINSRHKGESSHHVVL